MHKYHTNGEHKERDIRKELIMDDWGRSVKWNNEE